MLIPVTIEDTLAQLKQHCGDILGAAVATGDGLILAATDALSGDDAAACASSLAHHLSKELLAIGQNNFNEGLLWTSPTIWYIGKLSHAHLLLVHCATENQAGLLRIACQQASQQLNGILGKLD